MITDIRIACRTLIKTPTFTLTAVVVLALGIGANSAVFGLVNQVLLSPPGVAQPERVVAVRAKYEKLHLDSISLSGPDFGDVQRATDVFERVAVTQPRDLNFTGGGMPEGLRGAAVSREWFEVFGIPPALGHTFTAEDDEPNAAPTVVLSHAIWQRLFGGDATVLGRTIFFDQKPYKVLGVMPADFGWPRQADVWVPMGLPPAELTEDYRFNEHLTAVARIRQGLTAGRADTRVRLIADHVRAAAGDNAAFARSSRWGMFALPFTDYVAGDTKWPMLVLLGAVGFVLLIACSNIAGLVLARTANRSREIAVRAALGAQRWQLMRQVLSEGILLVSAGAIAAVGVAFLGMRLLITSAPEGAAVGLGPRIDAWVVLFTVAVSIVAGGLFALAPAWQVSRLVPYDYIKGSARTASAGPGRQRLRAGIVVVETALAMVLLVVSGLLIRSLMGLETINPGFEPRGVVTASLALPDAQYKAPEQRAAFYRTVLERLAAMPGVQVAGAGGPLPFVGGDSSASFRIEGQSPGPGDPGPHGGNRWVTPSYFAALRIPLERGRAFTDADRAGAEPVAIVDEILARRYWPGQDPIDKRIRRGGDSAPYLRIVGVVGSVVHSTLGVETDKGTYYMPLLQQPMARASFVVRMKPGQVERPAIVGEAVRSVDPTLPVTFVASMRDRVMASLASRRFVMRILAVFAAVALFMAALGLYGLISYSVAQRRQEIGIRMALGAGRATVLRLVLLQGVRLALSGLGVGLVGALAASRLIRSQLYQVSPFDPLTIAIVATALLSAAVLASYLPALSATRVDPLEALRYE